MKPKLPAIMMLMCFCAPLFAQKPASAQKSNLLAPANIRIDGKINEWNGKFQAYSHHTQFYYTVSNDNRFLYLTIQSTDDVITNRILQGGITLTINKSGKKKDLAGMHITYPVLAKRFGVNRKNAPEAQTGSIALDSFVNAINAQIEEKAKMIRVSGIAGVDTLISVYNLDGIKAAGLIDHQFNYNYELAISLKTLELNIDNPTKFTYQVMINEIADKDMQITNKGNGMLVVVLKAPEEKLEQEATDFWGEYTLAK